MSKSALIDALKTTYQINASVPSQTAIEQTVQTASDYFIQKNTIPQVRKWGIVAVDIPTTATLLYNIQSQYVQKPLGLLTSASLDGYQFDDVLWIIESDKFTPNYIFDMARAHTCGGLTGQILNLVHQSLAIPD